MSLPLYFCFLYRCTASSVCDICRKIPSGHIYFMDAYFFGSQASVFVSAEKEAAAQKSEAAFLTGWDQYDRNGGGFMAL